MNLILKRKTYAKLMLSLIFADALIVTSAINSSAALDWRLQGFFNVGIEGFRTTDGSYIDLAELSGVPVFDMGEFSKNLGVGYNVGFAIGGIKNISSPQLVDGILQSVTTKNNETLYYLWQKIDYSFDVLTYTRATEKDIISLNQITDSIQWFTYYYGEHRTWNNYQNDGPVITKKVDVQGWAYQGVPLGDVAPALTGAVRVRIALGNTITASTNIIRTNNGNYTFNGTTFSIFSPTLINGPSTNTQTDIVKRIELKVGKSEENQIIVEDKGQTKNEESNAPHTSINGLNLPQKAKDFMVSAQFTPEKVNYVNMTSKGWVQTLKANGTQLITYQGDGSEISGQFSPDLLMYPVPLTDAYIDIPVSLCPYTELKTFQYLYKKYTLWVGLHFVPWPPLGSDLFLDNNMVDNALSSRFVESRRVYNVYYIQTVKVPVYFASIYNWVPEPQAYPPIDPPYTNEIAPDLLINDKIGEGEVVIAQPRPDNTWANIFALAFIIPMAIGAVIVVIIVIIIFKVLKLSRPNKLMKMLQQGKQILSPQPINMLNTLAMPYQQPYPQPIQQMPQVQEQPKQIFYVDTVYTKKLHTTILFIAGLGSIALLIYVIIKYFVAI